MVRALVVSVLVGIMCPVIGSYVVSRGLGFMGDALAHAVLPGMVVAFMVGVSPFYGAIPAGIAVAILIGYLSRRTGVSEDTSIGVLFAGLFALGLAMLTLSRGLPVNLEDILTHPDHEWYKGEPQKYLCEATRRVMLALQPNAQPLPEGVPEQSNHTLHIALLSFSFMKCPAR